jgi:hypothetical protein
MKHHESVFTGGFANSKHQVDTIAHDISSYTGRPWRGVTLVDADRHPDDYAEMIDGKEVASYSGGIIPVSLSEAVPERLTAIMPATQTPITRLIGSLPLIAYGLTYDAVRTPTPKSIESNLLHLKHVIGEVALHSAPCMNLLHTISTFNLGDEIRGMSKRGTEIELAYSLIDEFFRYDIQKLSEISDSSQGITLNPIVAKHPDLITRTVGVLRQTGLAKQLVDNAKQLPLQSQERDAHQTLAG